MDVIQEVGAYAGFAAVVGLAVLAALFFSQARDLRRLREWAGRAPERAAEQAAVPQPARPTPTGAVRPIPAARPAQAAAAQTGAKPAAVTAKPATAAANAGAATEAKPEDEKPDDAKPGEKKSEDEKPDDAKPGDEKPDEAKPGTETPAPAVATTGKPAPATAAAAPPGIKPPAAPTPQPSRPPAIPSRPAPVGRTPAPATASQSTAVLPASARVRDFGRSEERRRGGLEGRYIALIVAGVLVIGGGAAFGISQLGGDDEAPSGNERAEQEAEPAGPLNRSLVTVSVLNGTTVPGLAAQIGDEIESKGFQRGNVANAIDQQRQDSVVLFAEGGERPARIVARGLGINTIEPVDPDSQALAGNASVVVIVGADQTQ